MNIKNNPIPVIYYKGQGIHEIHCKSIYYTEKSFELQIAGDKETYVVLSKDQFDLIKKPLLGSIQTANNQQLNSLRKYMDKPEAVQKILKDILTVSELASKLDKLS